MPLARTYREQALRWQSEAGAMGTRFAFSGGISRRSLYNQILRETIGIGEEKILRGC